MRIVVPVHERSFHTLVRLVCCVSDTAYVSNIIENPRDPKFRRINLTNKAFVARVASCGDHGVNFLTLCGFKGGGRAEYIPEGKDPAGFIVCQSTEEGGNFDGAMRRVLADQLASLLACCSYAPTMRRENAAVPCTVSSPAHSCRICRMG